MSSLSVRVAGLRHAIPAITTLASVGVVVVFILAVVWRQAPEKETLPYELAKMCLQVIGLVVLGGIVAFATSSVDHSRQKRAADALRHEESFKIRADLLNRAARCAATMYVTCRHVERLRNNGPQTTHIAEGHTASILGQPMFDEKFLSFSAEGLTLQTEIEATTERTEAIHRLNKRLINDEINETEYRRQVGLLHPPGR